MVDFLKLGLVFALLAFGAGLGFLIRGNPRRIGGAVFLLGFLPFSGHYELLQAFYDTASRATDRGFAITWIDVLVAALWGACPKARRAAPFAIGRWSYFLVSAATLLACVEVEYGVFALWTLVRSLALFVVLTRALQDPHRVRNLLLGLQWGVIYVTLLCLKLRYVDGDFQVSGPFEHQNTMAMSVYLVVPLFFALSLARRGGWIPLAAAGGGTLCIVMSLSRGSMTVFPVAMVIVYVTSLVRKLDSRKLLLGLGSVLAIAVVLVKGGDTIVARFVENAGSRSGEYRVLYNEMAKEMTRDHPLGVGLNQFPLRVPEYHGYAESLGGSWVEADSQVHHVYWLTAAELGYLGLACYLLVLASPLRLALVGAIRCRKDLRGSVLVGVGSALLVFSVHGTLEWAARQTVLMYLFWMLCAVVAAVSRHDVAATAAHASAERVRGRSRAPKRVPAAGPAADTVTRPRPARPRAGWRAP